MSLIVDNVAEVIAIVAIFMLPVVLCYPPVRVIVS
jgi:hypothetical protein